MSTLGLSGLASGVDTGGIIDQLMALERQKVTRLEYRRFAVNGEQESLKTIASKLAALKDAALALRTDATWKQTQTAQSSDPARVSVALKGGAGIGGHSIQVNRLASSMQRGYAFDSAAGGTVTIGGVDLTVSAGATLQSLADAINARGDLPVVAAIVTNDSSEERLVLSSRTTGSASDFTVSAPGVLTEDAAYETANPALLDASYSIDGGAAKTSATNVLENAVPGLRITLKGVTAAAATVSVTEPALDRAAIKDKITAFVNAYNAVVDTTRAELAKKPAVTPTSEFQAGYGQLFGDSGMQSMLSGLRRQMTEIVSGAGINDLADLGISVPKTTGGAASEDGKAGRLVIDDAKLSAALESDWIAVRDYFDGFAGEVETFVSNQTGSSGLIDARLKGSDRSIERINDQIERTNDRLEMKEKRMRAQFAAMELALQQAQTQQAWLEGQLEALKAQTTPRR